MTTTTAQRSDPAELVVSILRELGCAPKLSGGTWLARCPAHGDRTPSLGIASGADGRALLRCHAGCSIEAIVAALGLRKRDLFPRWGGLTRREVRPVPFVRQRPRVDRPWGELTERFERGGCGRLEPLAKTLGVSVDSLARLRCGWATREELARVVGHRVRSPGWTFPMMSGAGEIVGLSVRTPAGGKWSLSGSRLGLFIPKGLADLPGVVLIVEGASDVAAALDAGLTAVGRPSNCTGAEDLAEILAGREVVVCGEDDRKLDAQGEVLRWPGRDGAELVARRLAEAWRVDVPVAMPPPGVKDLRAWLQLQRVA